MCFFGQRKIYSDDERKRRNCFPFFLYFFFGNSTAIFFFFFGKLFFIGINETLMICCLLDKNRVKSFSLLFRLGSPIKMVDDGDELKGLFNYLMIFTRNLLRFWRKSFDRALLNVFIGWGVVFFAFFSSLLFKKRLDAFQSTVIIEGCHWRLSLECRFQSD